eukprot:gene22597-biopygen8775
MTRHSGVSGDPLHQLLYSLGKGAMNWRAIAVEALSHNWEELVRNYSKESANDVVAWPIPTVSVQPAPTIAWSHRALARSRWRSSAPAIAAAGENEGGRGLDADRARTIRYNSKKRTRTGWTGRGQSRLFLQEFLIHACRIPPLCDQDSQWVASNAALVPLHGIIAPTKYGIGV